MTPKHKEYAIDLLLALLIGILVVGGLFTLGIIH